MQGGTYLSFHPVFVFVNGTIFSLRACLLSDVHPFTEITGFTAEESVGKTPRILKSGVQAPLFYKNMWAALREKGNLVAEVKGIWSWENEEMVFDYLEKTAPPQFWEWLQGYQIQLDVKEHAACTHCGNG